MKSLPLDLNNFAQIQKNNCIYVDKTRLIYELLQKGNSYFLSRPRRFGKSLLTSTLDELLQGNKSLFQSCWINTSDYDWKQYPIITLDLSQITHASVESFKKQIKDSCCEIAQKYNIEHTTISEPSAIQMLSNLIIALHKIGPVVMLVAEYDGPLRQFAPHSLAFDANRELLKQLCTLIKDSHKYLYFFLITGSSEFFNDTIASGVSNIKETIFSGISSIVDISADNTYQEIVGYTEEELLFYFAPYLEKIAQDQHKTIEDVLHDMYQWQPSCTFAKDGNAIYNPSSCLSFMDKGIRKMWFSRALKCYEQQQYFLAHPLFEKAALQNHIEAQNYCGLMAQKGLGIEADVAIAKEWFEKAANQGHPSAQYSLGMLYFLGQGVAQDLELAHKWLEQAALHKHGDAQYQLTRVQTKRE